MSRIITNSEDIFSVALSITLFTILTALVIYMIVDDAKEDAFVREQAINCVEKGYSGFNDKTYQCVKEDTDEQTMDKKAEEARE